MNPRNILLAIVSLFALCVFAIPSQVAHADQLPPYLKVDANGKVTFDPTGLTNAGSIAMPPPDGWPSFQTTVPGTDLGVCVGCLTFNKYIASDGSTVVVPTAYSAIVMAMTGKSPFNTQPNLVIGNGIIAAAVAAGVFDNMGLAPDQVTPESVRHALETMDPLFFLKLNLALNDPTSPLFSGAFFFASGLFVFACDPITGKCANDQAIPPAVSTIYEAACQAQGHCLPIGSCPNRDWTFSQQAPVLSAGKLAPAFPVVVGQDPAKRGVDLQFSVTTFPVYVTYTYEHAETVSTCQWVGSGQGGGCGAGGPPERAADLDWGMRNSTRRDCRRHTDVFPDQIGMLTARAELTADSAAWISGDLAAKYPGAHVFEGVWPLYPDRPMSVGGFNSDRTNFTATYLHLPLLDPGAYYLTIAGKTLGTPYTQPRDLTFHQVSFAVNAVFTALTK
jgi:hypothetical protein